MVKICGYSVQGHCNTTESPIGENELCDGINEECSKYWIHEKPTSVLIISNRRGDWDD